MAYIEPTLTEDKVATIEQKYTKTNKTYLLVTLASGLRASLWDQELWNTLKRAQTDNLLLQVWYIKNEKGFTSITNLEIMPVGGAPVSTGEHFVKGAGSGLPAKPPEQRAAAGNGGVPASDLSTSDRVMLCLAVGMVAWGGVLIKNEEDFFKWLQKLEQYTLARERVLPGYETPPGPAYEGPEYQG